jgi:C-terminal processing protease CtpA/Prc
MIGLPQPLVILLILLSFSSCGSHDLSKPWSSFVRKNPKTKMSQITSINGLYEDLRCKDVLVILDLISERWIYPLGEDTNPRNLTKNELFKVALVGAIVHFEYDHDLSTEYGDKILKEFEAFDPTNPCKEFIALEDVVAEHLSKEIPRTHLYAYAIDTMVTYLDPHSRIVVPSFMSDKASSSLGINFAVERFGEGLRVLDLDLLSPAYLSRSLIKDDRILAYRHPFLNDIEQWNIISTPDSKIKAIHALNTIEVGSGVEMLISRDNQELEIIVLNYNFSDLYAPYTIKAKLFKIPAEKEIHIGYLNISSFELGTSDLFLYAVDSLRHQATNKNIELSGIILDLRNNGGGMIIEMEKIAATFVEEQISFWELFRPYGDMILGALEPFAPLKPRGGPKAYVGTYISEPTLVLINNHTASAAEVLAAAIQDQGRHMIIGEKSFGKFVAQQGYSLSDINVDSDGLIYLTESFIYTPSGVGLQTIGITPDITVTDVYLEQFRNALPHVDMDELAAEKDYHPQYYVPRPPSLNKSILEEGIIEANHLNIPLLQSEAFSFPISKEEIIRIFKSKFLDYYEASNGELTGDPLTDTILNLLGDPALDKTTSIDVSIARLNLKDNQLPIKPHMVRFHNAYKEGQFSSRSKINWNLIHHRDSSSINNKSDFN